MQPRLGVRVSACLLMYAWCVHLWECVWGALSLSIQLRTLPSDPFPPSAGPVTVCSSSRCRASGSPRVHPVLSWGPGMALHTGAAPGHSGSLRKPPATPVPGGWLPSPHSFKLHMGSSPPSPCHPWASRHFLIQAFPDSGPWQLALPLQRLCGGASSGKTAGQFPALHGARPGLSPAPAPSPLTACP